MKEKDEHSTERERKTGNSPCKAPTKAVGMECKAWVEGLVLEGGTEGPSSCGVTGGVGQAIVFIQMKEGRFTCLLVGH